ncbi:MAG: RNA pseudouridine synthase [Planctomycetes bacterium]|nr:RNA pseudouridine synthase [Planctomycetota bacterium]
MSDAHAPSPQVIRRLADWMVLDKPSGWHTVEQEGGDAASVEAWLRQSEPACAALQESGLCHRLDQWTSGCLVVAMTAEAHERLRDAFSQSGSGVRKSYLALARRGLSPEGRFRLHFQSRYKRSAKVSVREAGDAWSAGRCIWKVLRKADAGHDLVQVELIGPGRRHQIRAGLAHLGHPLAGDTLYGGSNPDEGQGPALHAWRIEIDGESVIAAPPPRFGPAPSG